MKKTYIGCDERVDEPVKKTLSEILKPLLNIREDNPYIKDNGYCLLYRGYPFSQEVRQKELDQAISEIRNLLPEKKDGLEYLSYPQKIYEGRGYNQAIDEMSDRLK